MGGTNDSLSLAFTYVLAVLVGFAWCWEGACLQDGRHKAKPGPEPSLRDCMLYEKNSCCSQENIADILYSTPTGMANTSWDVCGSLSPSCQDFLKQVACFQHCSPDAILWAHPHHRDTIQTTPLCHSFCTDWFEACKNDLTCTRNWSTDWAGINCTGPCVPFHQVYTDGRDLCNRAWGDAFVTAEDMEEGGDRGPCCLTLSPSDRVVIDALRKRGRPCRRRPQPTAPPQARRGRKNMAVTVSKRSVTKDDAEGSGSGF